MQPKNDSKKSQVKIPTKLSLPKLSAKLLAAVAAVLILAAAGSYYFISYRPNHTNSSVYTYKTLNTYTLPSEKPGNGISLQKPVELTAIGASSPKQAQTFLSHTLTKNSQQPVTAAQIFLASVNTGVELQDGYKKNINTMITDPKNVSHEAVIKPLKDYVTQRLKTTLITTFSEAKPLVATDNIKSNAWYLTFTATPKDAVNKATQPDLSGQAILAIGKTSYYYIMVYSLASNWQSNQKVWDQVINSIKLDQ